MRDDLKYFPVNWINGMKINKDHFIAQDNAGKCALIDVASLNLSPVRYGILPASASGTDTFEVQSAIDNQQTLRVSVLKCSAVTPGGVRITIPASGSISAATPDGVPALSYTFTPASNQETWWLVLTVNPYDGKPFGSPDIAENPPRYPFIVPSYGVQVVSDNQFAQMAGHPYTLTIGKLVVTPNEVIIDDAYIPPCYSISSHPDLVSLFSELDHFLAGLEISCSQIVQKILRKNQQNEISELVMFVCDRVILFLSQTITNMRFYYMHESPVHLFAAVASLARVMKNSIDLRTGTGKEEMMNYLSEWCELKQGELESLLSAIASIRYDNNDINKNIEKVVSFVKVISRLFDTLSKLDFIGKRRESGIFVKEEPVNAEPQAKARRRFFG